MNANDFVTESEYKYLKQEILKGSDFKFEKEIKQNYNTYRFWLNVATAHYTLNEYGWATGFLEMNYSCKELSDGRSISGATINFYSKTDNYDTFKKTMNKRLKNTPDYTEYEQIRLQV